MAKISSFAVILSSVAIIGRAHQTRRNDNLLGRRNSSGGGRCVRNYSRHWKTMLLSLVISTSCTRYVDLRVLHCVDEVNIMF
jgi:hypothetical protein